MIFLFTVFFILIFIQFWQHNCSSCFYSTFAIIYNWHSNNLLAVSRWCINKAKHLPFSMCSLIIYLDRILHLCSFIVFVGEMQRIAFRLMILSCVRVYAAFVDLRKTLSDKDRFYKLCGITPDIICKSLTQIGLQIPRWRPSWRPWNTIIGRNSAIYRHRISLNCA